MIAKLIRFGSLALLLISLSAHSVPPGAAMTEEQMQQMMAQIPMIAPDDVNRSGHVCDNM